ncbi:hypothetical protein H5410_060339 [Solanum commersonii]|uniref:Uncharacterized protein n=1 Tax=Solanum commersonii TaxID=4109 RepID=A0A9J5W4U4_SOLCO|nr:hypothetical protein H5410_060339 [Solanum commersonii]
MYLFVALRPLIRGFDYCRPIVVIDGAHLGGAYKGTFVSASTLDGAGCIFPLAYGVVDENGFMDMVLRTIQKCIWRAQRNVCCIR